MDDPSTESNQKNKAKVLLIDDHPIVRQGLTQLINATMDLVVCDEASRARDALQMLKSLTPDIVIVDISLEDRNGVALIKDILACHPTCRVWRYRCMTSRCTRFVFFARADADTS